MKGLGQFILSKSELKELSDVELAMHCEYMYEKYKKLKSMRYDCKLPLDENSYDVLNVPEDIQKEFGIIFKNLMKEKITEANFEFQRRDSSIYVSNIFN
ncbi:hypothetical protein [Staphylococcus agnetis]|uniref:hypothetical protein n=1 Tax=Staphylococcus agnetis TaxID=985762 RepID=UPI00208FC25B|nr:hypothetical protein [Staphylococcus agnetis]MCO4347502.1 hypothetical protein [Staphylococcus agnetis]